MRALVLVALVLGTGFGFAAPLGTAFTYQGRLSSDTGPATGLYDLSFTAYDAPLNGSQQGLTALAGAVGVTNGLFTVTLDLGAVFSNNALWLSVSVKTNGAPGYTTLAPRQPLTPAPYALYAQSGRGGARLGHHQRPGGGGRHR